MTDQTPPLPLPHVEVTKVDAAGTTQVTLQVTLTFQQMDWLSSLLTEACLTVPCLPPERAFRRDLATRFAAEVTAAQDWYYNNLEAEENERQHQWEEF